VRERAGGSNNRISARCIFQTSRGDTTNFFEQKGYLVGWNAHDVHEWAYAASAAATPAVPRAGGQGQRWFKLWAFKTVHGYSWEPQAARSDWFSTGLKMLVRQHLSRPECAAVWARTNLSSSGGAFKYFPGWFHDTVGAQPPRHPHHTCSRG